MRWTLLLVAATLALAGCASKKETPEADGPEGEADEAEERGEGADTGGGTGAPGGTVPTSRWRYDNRTGEASGVAPETESNPPVKPVHETFSVAEGVENLSLRMTVEDYAYPNAWVYPPCDLEDASACPFFGFGIESFENGTASREFADPAPGDWRVRFTSGATTQAPGPYAYTYAIEIAMRP